MRSLRNWYVNLVASFRPARFAGGAAAYYSPPCPTVRSYPNCAGYLTTFRKITERPGSRLCRVDLHGTLHDVTYVLPRTRLHVKTLQMMGR